MSGLITQQRMKALTGSTIPRPGVKYMNMEELKSPQPIKMKETISGTQSFEIIRTMLACPFLAGMMKGTGCPVHVDLSKAEYSTSFAYSEIAAYLIRLGEAAIEFNKAE